MGGVTDLLFFAADVTRRGALLALRRALGRANTYGPSGRSSSSLFPNFRSRDLTRGVTLLICLFFLNGGIFRGSGNIITRGKIRYALRYHGVVF